ncbi:MAG TPA: hypothetical protein VGS41_04325, partial [Chthonomonadales bacterium]|nr:hypothetical protein [Chthonomonadales bacterium]
WLHALIAGALTAPSVAYVYYQFRTEAVFHARAEVATLAPPLAWELLGYGLLVVLAVVGAIGSIGKGEFSPDLKGAVTRQGGRLLATWAVVNVAVSYIPAAFQRKLLQGAHIPIAILAAYGAYVLLEKAAPRHISRSGLTLAAVVLPLCPTNILFVLRDLQNYAINRVQTQTQRAYLQPGEVSALAWIGNHSAPSEALQPLPWVSEIHLDDGSDKIRTTDTTPACWAPGMIDRPVYCGHWGETPNYPMKLSELARFALPTTSNSTRIDLLRKMKVRYLMFSQKGQDDPSADRLAPMFRGLVNPPPFLTLRYSNRDADVYEVRLEPAG